MVLHWATHYRESHAGGNTAEEYIAALCYQPASPALCFIASGLLVGVLHFRGADRQQQVLLRKMQTRKECGPKHLHF